MSDEHPGSSDEATDFEPIAERLRAADPAQGISDDDLDGIRARVLAGSTADVVPLRSRRSSWVVAGTVAAGVVLLAGAVIGGVAIGRGTAPMADAPAAPVEDSIPVVGAASPPLASVSGAAGTAPNAAAESSADKAMIYPGYGVTLLPAPDLPNDAGTARGYRLVDNGVDREALAALLATTFGVEGQPREEEWGDWRVGTDEGPSLWVSQDPMVSWSYWNPTIVTWDCAYVEPAPAEGDSSGTAEPAPDECLPDIAPPGTRDAVKEAKGILAGLGVGEDPAYDTSLEWEASSDDWSTWVTAWQLVDGQRTQLSWQFSFTGEGLQSANGFAAGLEAVPAYPIVGARTAVLRSADPKYSSLGPSLLGGGGVYPMAQARDTGVVASEGTSVASDGAAAADVPPGDPDKVQVWWDPAVVTGAQLTLAQYWQPDGTLLILPAYSVTTADDRGTWAIIAVADSALDFIAP